ncbi:hypothetical protein JCM19379_17800 [Methyloparacoccus murrellii]
MVTMDPRKIPDDHAPEAASPTPGTAPTSPAVPPAPDPTRYGDWEKAGRCIDF